MRKTNIVGVDILGTDYEILVQAEEENPKLKDNYGLCETWSKKIVLLDMGKLEQEPDTVENVGEFEKKVLRHEVIHAFFHESGLASNSDYALNEELVDWIALQFPKMLKVFRELECVGLDEIVNNLEERAEDDLK